LSDGNTVVTMAEGTSNPQAFGAELRRRRGEKGLSLTRLAALVNYSKSHLSKVESGTKKPSAEFARQCDRALSADGELSRLAPPRETPRSSPDAEQEGEVWTMQFRDDGSGGFHALSRRTLLTSGAAAVMAWSAPRSTPAGPMLHDALSIYGRLLGELRALGQTSRPSDVLQITAGTTNALRTQAPATAAADRPAVLLLAARFAEYAGWMAQEIGDDNACAWWTRQAVDMARVAGDSEMASYAHVRAAEIALYRDDPIGVLNAAHRALAHDASPRVQAFALQRTAQGHALNGDETACLRALDEAVERFSQISDDNLAHPLLGSRTMRDPIAFVTGWCLLDLGKPKQSAEILSQEFAHIPSQAHRVRARYGARLALALANQRELDHACAVAVPTLVAAQLVDSATVRTELRRLSRTLRRWHHEAAVRQIMPDLASALHTN
jgi:transcriptional regulator with XRE-family HTH domain